MDFCLLVSVVAISIPQCPAQQYPEWQGGDWAFGESLLITNDPKDEWNNYLLTLGEEYDDSTETTTKKQEFIAPNEQDLRNDPPDWYPLAPDEEPYLAVIYRRDRGADYLYKTFFRREPEPKGTHVWPGTACGGALLSPRYVITSCGCLLTLITTLYTIPNPIPQNSQQYYQRYNIRDGFNEQDIIYVTHATTDFEPDFKHEIDLDPNKWSPELNCKDTLSKMYTHNEDHFKTTAVINAEPVVAPFTPAVTPNFFRYFPKWPPVFINQQTDSSYKEQVDLISIGMILAKAGRRPFFSAVSASVTELRHCRNQASIVCNESRISVGDTHACFCPLRPGIQKLTHGTIGWPLVQKGSLVGITASERHDTDGTVLAISMHQILKEKIERYINKQVLLDQNNPTPLYRANELKRKFSIYDYDNVRGKTIVSQSKATTNGPKFITFFPLIVIFWISTA